MHFSLTTLIQSYLPYWYSFRLKMANHEDWVRIPSWCHRCLKCAPWLTWEFGEHKGNSDCEIIRASFPKRSLTTYEIICSVGKYLVMYKNIPSTNGLNRTWASLRNQLPDIYVVLDMEPESEGEKSTYRLINSKDNALNISKKIGEW